MTALRFYEPHELAADGYPPEWHRLTEPEHTALLDAADLVLPGGIKHVVRALAGNRCVRCLHPYRSGGEWSRCDQYCTHRGPFRYRHGPEDQWFEALEDEPWAAEAGTGQAVGIEVEARWRILTVHHLDGVKANCRWWNLAPLCQRCHLQVQGKVKMERVWPWEHTPWFRPYVAGYYAWTYLREDLTREETEARLDELLALERLA